MPVMQIRHVFVLMLDVIVTVLMAVPSLRVDLRVMVMGVVTVIVTMGMGVCDGVVMMAVGVSAVEKPCNG